MVVSRRIFRWTGLSLRVLGLSIVEIPAQPFTRLCSIASSGYRGPADGDSVITGFPLVVTGEG